MRLTSKSYNREDIHNIIVLNKLECQCCHKKMWFDLSYFKIEHQIGKGPKLTLRCNTCRKESQYHIFGLKRPMPRETEEETMCYTGRCKYEDYMGECNFSSTDDFPQDAECVQQDLYILQEEMINDYKKVLNQDNKIEPLNRLEENDVWEKEVDPFENLFE